MSVKWYRRKWVWAVGAIASLLVAAEAGLVLSGERMLIGSTIVHPRQTLVLPGYGNVGSKSQSSLVCRYFTGRGIATDVIRYSATNRMGRDECPFYAVRRNGEAGGSAADWVSGIGSLLAVIAALFGYFLVERKHQRDDREKTQGQIYQIAFKLKLLIDESGGAVLDLKGAKIQPNEFMALDHPLAVVMAQFPTIGYDKTMVRDLSDAEQNLLMILREENFLMDFSEAVARNASIRSAFVEYCDRREELQAELPTPDSTNGEMGSFETTPQRVNELMPLIIPAAALVIRSREMAAENVKVLTALCKRFKPMMQGHFPKMHVPEIEIVEQVEGAADQAPAA